MGTHEGPGRAIPSRAALIETICAQVGRGWPRALIETVATALWHRGHALYQRAPSAAEWQALLETQLARELGGQLRPIRLVVLTPAGGRRPWAELLGDRVATLAQARERVREAGFHVLSSAPAGEAGLCHEVPVTAPDASGGALPPRPGSRRPPAARPR